MLVDCKLHLSLAKCDYMQTKMRPFYYLHVQVSLEGIDQLDTKVWLVAALLKQVCFLHSDH